MVGTAATVDRRPTVPPAVVRMAGRAEPAPAAKAERAATEGPVSVQAPMVVTVVEAAMAVMDREAAPVAVVTVGTEIPRETAGMEDPAVLGLPVAPAWGVSVDPAARADSRVRTAGPAASDRRTTVHPDRMGPMVSRVIDRSAGHPMIFDSPRGVLLHPVFEKPCDGGAFALAALLRVVRRGRNQLPSVASTSRSSGAVRLS